MFRWLENFMLKRIIKRITKRIPTLKKEALKYLEEHSDELLVKFEEKLEKVTREFIENHSNKEV
jgi:hypothetical protein